MTERTGNLSEDSIKISQEIIDPNFREIVFRRAILEDVLLNEIGISELLEGINDEYLDNEGYVDRNFMVNKAKSKSKWAYDSMSSRSLIWRSVDDYPELKRCSVVLFESGEINVVFTAFEDIDSEKNNLFSELYENGEIREEVASIRYGKEITYQNNTKLPHFPLLLENVILPDEIKYDNLSTLLWQILKNVMDRVIATRKE